MDEDDNTNMQRRNGGAQQVQGALSISNSILIIGGTLFTIAAFFVSLSYRITTVESTLKDFPLYRVENRLTSIEQSIGQLREEMRDKNDTTHNNKEGK